MLHSGCKIGCLDCCTSIVRVTRIKTCALQTKVPVLQGPIPVIHADDNPALNLQGNPFSYLLLSPDIECSKGSSYKTME